MFTPYVGAGIGFIYNQISRDYTNDEVQVVTATQVRFPIHPISIGSLEQG